MKELPAFCRQLFSFSPGDVLISYGYFPHEAIRTMRRTRLCTLLLTCCTSCAALAQQPATPAAAPDPGGPNSQAATPQTSQNTIQANARLVVLDMTVVDADGKPRNDLFRSEFHVTEDGVEQTIRNFDPPGRYLLPPDAKIDSTADLERIAPRTPVNIILLDNVTTAFRDKAFAYYSLEKWFATQPAQLSTPTMLLAVSVQKFEVLRDYTQNKQEILDALKRYSSDAVNAPPSVHSAQEVYSTAFLTLRRVAEATVGHAGHKNMIWIGKGFPQILTLPADGEVRVENALQRTLDELRDARVTLYTVDPAGISAYVDRPNNNPFADFGGNPDFAHLAVITGGRALYGRNDVDAEIGTAIRDGSSIYTLTYRPSDPAFDLRRLRHVAVTVDNPTFKVLAAKGYYQPQPVRRVDAATGVAGRDIRAQMAGAETSSMVYDAVPVKLLPSTVSPDNFMIHVDARNVAWSNATDTSPRNAALVVMVTTFDKKGGVIKRDARRVLAHPPATDPPTGPLQRDVNLEYKIDRDPNATRARIVVRVEASGRLGTADVDLTKPLAQQLASQSATN